VTSDLSRFRRLRNVPGAGNICAGRFVHTAGRRMCVAGSSPRRNAPSSRPSIPATTFNGPHTQVKGSALENALTVAMARAYTRLPCSIFTDVERSSWR